MITTPTLTIRVATPDEGPMMGWFLRDTAYATLDWTQPLIGTWLIAENEEQPLGCVAVNPGVPVGHIDLLHVEPTLSHRQKAIVVRDLSYAGLEYLKQLGSQVVKTYFSQHDQRWQSIATRRGGVVVDRGTIVLKRL